MTTLTNQPPMAEGTPGGATAGRSPYQDPGAQPLHQRCQRCGTEEAAGDFCTWCAMAAYDLIEHTHEGRKAGTCPLGPYLNPSNAENRTPSKQAQLSKARAAWDATHDPAEAEPYIVRRWRHPENPRIAGDPAYIDRHPAINGAERPTEAAA